MPLTSADVRNVVFSKPPIGKRGYHEDEVDTFLDLVAAELARLITENTDLRLKVAQLNQQQRAAPINSTPNVRPFDASRPPTTLRPPRGVEQPSPGHGHHVQAAKVLEMAQQIADQVISEAKAVADEMLTKAQTTAAQLLSDARGKTDGMVNEARTRAEAMLCDARTKAETLERQSQEKAVSLERDAARKHTDILGSLSQEKTFLEKRINELRTFEREYRIRLKTYLTSQLQELSGPESAVPVHPVRNQQNLVASGSSSRAEPGSHDSPLSSVASGAVR